MAILDLYKASKGNYKEAGTATTDFIKGINPQQITIAYKGDAAEGFTPNLTPADKPNTKFNMVDTKTNTTIKDFNPLDVNNDYQYGTSTITGYNFEKLFNDGKLTNPKG